ncbi:MAG: alpha/beta hydrolase [Paraburkholderia sp.]|jgi:pimeloyl-ACP methyl ester carboxylesterase|uniref:alpha/beta fold hydrolase n=1 Tax=Burkholderiaceae TaxID=119060 RepID=UPI0010F857D1|nr:alpha/beta hydrolase [Burkholderia sp. 4M9327F10]
MRKALRVLLIHGLIGSLDPAILTETLGEATVIAPDMPGYGAYADVAPESISLPGQVEFLHDLIQSHAEAGERWHVIGHSVGGAIAALFAARYPERVESVVSIEGNFTLDDAFWSQKLARMSLDEARAILAADRADPGKWLEGAGIAPSEALLAQARAHLDFQPASTLQRVAASVVEITGRASYLEMIDGWIDTIPLHLLSGERSAAGWHVPPWVRQRAASYTELPGCGHLMMMEKPRRFAEAIQRLLEPA